MFFFQLIRTTYWTRFERSVREKEAEMIDFKSADDLLLQEKGKPKIDHGV